MENIIVTGGFGFIGLNLISFLTNEKKYIVHNIDNLSLGHSFFDYFLNTNQKNLIQNYKEDINNSNVVSEILEKYNITKVFHLAAESHVDRSISGPISFYSSNVMGTLRLVECCRKYIIKKKKLDFKFLHVSTDEVFGDLGVHDNSFNENTPYNPSSPYSSSKAASDFIIKSWFRTYNFPGIITNCSNNFGPAQNVEKFIPLSIDRLLTKKVMGIYGTGENIRDWLFVENHVKTLNTIMLKGKIGETYCIGGNKELSNVDLFKTIHKIMKNEMELDILPLDQSYSFVKDRLGHDYRYSVDIKKITKDFNLNITTNINEDLLKTIKFYSNLKKSEIENNFS